MKERVAYAHLGKDEERREQEAREVTVRQGQEKEFRRTDANSNQKNGCFSHPKSLTNIREGAEHPQTTWHGDVA